MSTYDKLLKVAQSGGWEAEGITRCTRFTRGDQTIHVWWCSGPRFMIRQANMVSSGEGDVDAVWPEEFDKAAKVEDWLRS